MSEKFWSNVMLVDEKKFELIMKLRKKYICRKKGMAYDIGNTQGYTRSQSAVVWGCFGANGIGDLVVIDSRMNGILYRDIIKKYLRSSAKKIELKRGWKLLKENDPKHKSKIVKLELKNMRIKCIDHPPQSPDMNSKENLWYIADRNVAISDRSSTKVMLTAIFRG